MVVPSSSHACAPWHVASHVPWHVSRRVPLARMRVHGKRQEVPPESLNTAPRDGPQDSPRKRMKVECKRREEKEQGGRTLHTHPY